MSNVKPAPSGAEKLYFAAWRWHFFAGLYVIPFLLILAITGFFMMLFTTYLPEYGDRIAIEAVGEPLLPTEQMAAAIAAVPGGKGIEEYIAPYTTTTPALITVTGPQTAIVVAVNPYSGAVLRQTEKGNTWNAFLEKIHGDLMIGTTGDILIEIAAGLGLVMVATGLYLWWPRKDGLLSMLWPDFAAKGRAWWKSLHQVIGFWTSAMLVIFLVTGMAWAGIWGEKWVQAWSTFPAEKWDNVPLSDATHASMNHAGEKEVPWPLEQTQMPESGSFTGQDVLAAGSKIDLDAMVALGRMIGLEGRFRVKVPGEDVGVYTLAQNSMSYDGNGPTGDRTVHVDRYTGRVLADVRFADYAVAGKAMAVGIALHEGQMGLWNFAVNAVFLLAIVLICVSGIVMWWKRRPAKAGRLAAPPRPQELPLWKGALAIAVALCMLFPLIGAVLIAVLLLDVLVLQNLPALKRVLS